MNPTVPLPPTAPFTSQVTLWSALPLTTAENCFVALTGTLAFAGLTLTDTEDCSACPELTSIIRGVTSTASKSEPFTLPRVCRSESFQPGAGAPEADQSEPLSAMPTA